jgi:alpha-L-fucosidase
VKRDVPNWLVVVVLLLGIAVPAKFVLPAKNAPVQRHPTFCEAATYGHGQKALPPLGLFVHYGPSSLVNETTTIRWWRAMTRPSYARTVARFRPNPAAADQWVALAKRMGAGSVAITAKHHDGYELWNSQTTDYGVGRKDVVARVARDAHREGLGLVLYFSLVDVHASSYPNDWPTYLRLVKAQLRELLTRYGKVAGVWFDGPGWAISQRKTASEWGLDTLYAEIHRLQPDAEIVTNHHCGRPLAGEGATTSEAEMPRHRTHWPQQAVFSLADQWFYSTHERPISHRAYLRLRAGTRRVGASLLVNLPPRGDGSLDPRYVRALLGS